MENNNLLIDIKNELLKEGYEVYANLLMNYLPDYQNTTECLIGFIGDDLVGKSTIVNAFIGEKLLPTGVIPTTAEIMIKQGEQQQIISNENLPENIDITDVLEQSEKVEIVLDSEFLKENNLSIKEFPGIINKKKISDVKSLLEVYKCDSVVLVISAEHLLSELECLFIEKYIQYVGEEHLLIVINKLDLLDNSDAKNVLEYARKQMNIKFPSIKWMVFEQVDGASAEEYVSKSLREAILELSKKDRDNYEKHAINMLKYIKEELENEIKLIDEQQARLLNSTIRKNEEILQKKRMEETSIEKDIIEFKQKRNISIERIDQYIKKQFEQFTKDIINIFNNVPDKYEWYEKELEKYCKSKILKISRKVNKLVTEIIKGDVEWINRVTQTKLGLNPMGREITLDSIKSNQEIIPYNTYKKYVPIGTGGAVVIGYCLFNMVGAIVGLGGGALVYSYLGMKDNVQIDEMRRKIISRIREISSETRKKSREDIDVVYENLITEFENEVKKVIESKYKTLETNSPIYEEKKKSIVNILKLIEE